MTILGGFQALKVSILSIAFTGFHNNDNNNNNDDDNNNNNNNNKWFIESIYSYKLTIENRIFTEKNKRLRVCSFAPIAEQEQLE